MIQHPSKWFVLSFCFFICLSIVFLYGLHYVNRIYYDLNNYTLWRYQLKKLESAPGVETIIVGDSSLGNALDAKLFSELSGEKTLSLTLMGTTGFEGHFNMIRHALQTQPIKNVVIMSTLRLWDRPFNKGAYFETLGTLSNPKPHYSLFPSKWGEEYMRFFVNIYDIPLYFSFIRDLNLLQRRKIDPVTDYVVQGKDKFSNGGKGVTEKDCLPEIIHEERKILFHNLDQICINENLNCIYIHGPLHEEVAACSLPQINAIRGIVRGGQQIIPLEKIFLFPSEKMGDAVDHIDNKVITDVTKKYFEAVKPFLK